MNYLSRNDNSGAVDFRWHCSLKPIPWRLAEFYYKRGLQIPYTGAYTMQETINRFLCPLTVFLKSKTHQLNFEGRDEIE